MRTATVAGASPTRVGHAGEPRGEPCVAGCLKQFKSQGPASYRPSWQGGYDPLFLRWRLFPTSPKGVFLPVFPLATQSIPRRAGAGPD